MKCSLLALIVYTENKCQILHSSLCWVSTVYCICRFKCLQIKKARLLG